MNSDEPWMQRRDKLSFGADGLHTCIIGDQRGVYRAERRLLTESQGA